MWRWLGLVALVGCSRGDIGFFEGFDTFGFFDTFDREGPRGDPCDLSLLSVSPAHNAEDVWVGGPFVVEAVGSEVPEVSLELVDFDGVAVPTTREVLGDGWVQLYWPATPLAPQTRYALEVDLCGDLDTSFFKTGDASPVGDPAALGRAVWDVAVEGTWRSPLQSPSQLLGRSESLSMSIGLTGVGGVEARVGGDALATCAPTSEMSGSWTDPVASWSVGSAWISAAGAPLGVDELAVVGALEPAGGRLRGASIVGKLDVVDLVAAWGLSSSPEEVCGTFEAAGASCVPCPSDVGRSCVPLDVVGTTGVRRVGEESEARTLEAVTADPDCAG